MEETYTFSRALHMMRYGGKKMKPIMMGDDWIEVKYGKLIGCFVGGKSIVLYPDILGEWITPEDIMGSWVEVKDAK